MLARLVEAVGRPRARARWLELDPLHEPAHRALIRLYARSAATARRRSRQYRECVRTLSRELGVPPLAETTRLYEAISEGTLEAPSTRAGGGSAGAARRAPLVGRERESARAGGAAYGGIGARRAAPCCSRARPGSARRGSPRSSSRTRASAAPRCWAAAPTRRRRRSPTARSSRRCARACARTTAWVAAVPERALAEAARLLPDLSAAAPPPLDGPAAQARFLDGVWETLAAAAAGAGARDPRRRRRAVGRRGDDRAAQPTGCAGSRAARCSCC